MSTSYCDLLARDRRRDLARTADRLRLAREARLARGALDPQWVERARAPDRVPRHWRWRYR